MKPASSAVRPSNKDRRASAANRPARNRRRLLEVGADLFADAGIANVSVAQIVAAADVSRATFYGLFENKNQLAAAILLPVFASGIRAMTRLHSLPPQRAAGEIFRVYLNLWYEHRNALLLTGSFNNAVFPYIRSRHDAFNRELEKALRVIDSGNLLKNDSVEQTIEVLAKTGIPLLRIYRKREDLERIYIESMYALVIKTREAIA